jgi:hypothetical protein
VGLGQKDVGDISKLHYVNRFGFYSLEEIANMSLNDLRMRVSTHDKTLIGPIMEEPSIALDLGH